jgi:hypothetical protein
MTINSKIPKSNAGYGSNPAGFSCGVCMYFRANSCVLVEGLIKAKNCCNLFNSQTYRAAK